MKWIKCEDALPREGKYVLFTDGNDIDYGCIREGIWTAHPSWSREEVEDFYKLEEIFQAESNPLDVCY